MKRWLPISIIIVLFVLMRSMGWYRYFNFQSLAQHHDVLRQWVQQHNVAAACCFVMIYILAVAISIPGASLLTLMGGYLFGIMPGAIYVVISATIGAVVIFLAVRLALGNWLQKKASGWVAKMEKGFQQHAFNYLLFLRLVPVFPFWAVNIVSALLNVRLRLFFLATLLGIIPGSLVYVAVGNGLGDIFATSASPDLSIVFKPSILIPILCLALLSLVPIIYKKVKERA